jgi:hypothetical protein
MEKKASAIRLQLAPGFDIVKAEGLTATIPTGHHQRASSGLQQEMV